ncbi:MAG: hypothetical protein ACXVYV_04115 [Gaiellales bacterium]
MYHRRLGGRRSDTIRSLRQRAQERLEEMQLDRLLHELGVGSERAA